MSLPVVFLPGMMCDARLFTPQLAAFPNHAVMVAPITAYATMTELAAHILANAPPRFALAGLSMGGIVAMEMVRQAAPRIAGLCLMDTNPLAEPPERQAAREPQIARASQGELTAIMRDEMKPNYLADTKNRADILTLCMDMAKRLGKEVFIRQSRALQTRPDQCAHLKTYQAPTLIMHGAADTLCPAARHELLHTLMPHATYRIIDNAGHLITLEQPNSVNQHLTTWLTRAR